MNKDLKFVVGFMLLVVLLAFAYVVAITWLPIPKENQRFADTSLGVILGTCMVGGISFIKSIWPGTQQATTPAGTTTTTIAGSVTTAPAEGAAPATTPNAEP